MSKKAPNGAGTIRRKTVTRAGKEYTYWEARYTAGRDPGTGKQVQRSITGKTQKEVAEKLRAATASIDNGTYIAPSKMTVGEWLDIWAKDYLGGVKPRTETLYKATIANHLKPALGTVRLEALTTPAIQNVYNRLSLERAPKTVKNVHGVLHRALQKAVEIEYLRFNPADACELPRAERKAIAPLDEDEISRFLTAAKGHRYEPLYLVTLFTGMRLGEIVGLQWDCVDFTKGTINVRQQLQKVEGEVGKYRLISPKSGKGRTVTPAPFVMGVLKKQRAHQAELQLKAGPLWQGEGFVFADDLGHHLSPHTVYENFKKIVSGIGRPDARFHDLRHTYAVSAIRAGDDIKTVQGNLGHHTAAFTLDVYGHVTEQMKQESAARMEGFIKDVLGL